MSSSWFHPTVIYYFHGREIGSTRRFISLPRCREVGFIQRLYIIYTVVRSSLPDGLLGCHGVVRFPTVIYYFHGREIGFTRRFISLSRCCEIGSIQRLYIISTAVRSGLPDDLGWVHGTIHCWFLSKL